MRHLAVREAVGGVACLPSNRRTCLRVTRKQGQAKRDPRREHGNPLLGRAPTGRGEYGARDQADRSDNTASRACRFEVSAEEFPNGALFSDETHNSLSSKY